MDDDHRSTLRHRVLKAGRGGAISRTFRNLSEHSALLDVTSPIGIPDAFSLVLDSGTHRCRVIWRKERRIGIRFTEPRSNA